MLADIAPYVAVAALAAVVALAGVAYWLTRRLAELGRRQSAVLGPRERRDIVAFVLELEEQVDNLREAVTILTEEVELYRHDLDAALSNIAVVRFDAFADAGGEQSASIALLDNYSSGIVISIIASRETARLYVKFLDHGLPDRQLAPEEQAAVQRAVPSPLPRGELSRSPVSTFSRDVRRAIEDARRGAAAGAGQDHDAGAMPFPEEGEAMRASVDESVAGDTAESGADAALTAAPRLPADDETWSWEVGPDSPSSSSVDWSDEWRPEAESPDRPPTGDEPSGTTGAEPEAVPGAPEESDPKAAAPAPAAAPAERSASGPAEASSAGAAGESAPGPAEATAAGRVETVAADPEEGIATDPRETAAVEMPEDGGRDDEANGLGGPAAGATDGTPDAAHPHPPKDRRPHDDWLGGDELEF